MGEQQKEGAVMPKEAIASGIALAVVNYGSAEMIRENLSGVLAAFPSVLVDNYTSDEERSRLEAIAASTGASAIANTTNLGFGVAADLAVQRLVADGAARVLLVNPDVKLTVDDVRHLAAAGAASPDAMIAPIITKGGKLWFAGGVLDGRRVIATHVDPTHAAAVEVDWLTGACLLVPAAAWVELGGFDRRYFLYWEDVDLTVRWKLHGGRLLICEEVTVEHEVGGTQGGKSLGYSYYNSRNRMLFAANSNSWRGLLRGIRYAAQYERVLLLRSGSVGGVAAAHRRAIRRGMRNGLLRAARDLVHRPSS